MRPSWLALLAILVFGCQRESRDVREWRPSDHDHTSEPSRGQVDVSDGGSEMLRAHGLDEVIIATWRSQCMRCHGVAGRGDGPEAARWHPRDLGQAEWQRRTSDDLIRQAIERGKGAMPPSHLPDSTLDGLVRLVRLMAEPATPPAGSAPSGSAPSAPPAAPH